MKIHSAFRYCQLLAALWVGFNSSALAQKTQMSYANAFNMLNSGNKTGNTKVAAVISNTSGHANAMAAALATANYTKKVQVSYGIPIKIVLEYAVVKSNLSSDMASDPATYNNSSDEVQQAFVNLAYGDFVKISDYNKVNVKLNFRFNPAKLVVYGSDDYDFINNTKTSPWDVNVYKTPNTPVSGTKIMIIQK
jgi:hypothetical protein